MRRASAGLSLSWRQVSEWRVRSLLRLSSPPMLPPKSKQPAHDPHTQAGRRFGGTRFLALLEAWCPLTFSSLNLPSRSVNGRFGGMSRMFAQ